MVIIPTFRLLRPVFHSLDWSRSMISHKRDIHPHEVDFGSLVRGLAAWQARSDTTAGPFPL